MGHFRVYFADGSAVSVEADNGTQAKAIARTQRGVKKTELKIASVMPIEAPAPRSPADASPSALA